LSLHREAAVVGQHDTRDVRALLGGEEPERAAISAGSANRPTGMVAVISASRSCPTAGTIAVAALGAMDVLGDALDR
jgi:hypothetical protein